MMWFGHIRDNCIAQILAVEVRQVEAGDEPVRSPSL